MVPAAPAFIVGNMRGVVDTGEPDFIVSDKDRFDDDVGFVCFPRGPDLDAAKSSRDNGALNVYAIPSCSMNPEGALEYMLWMLSDEADHEARKAYVTDIFYGGSERLYGFGLEWEANSVRIDPVIWGDQVRDAVSGSAPGALADSMGGEVQGLLDMYVNAFL